MIHEDQHFAFPEDLKDMFKYPGKFLLLLLHYNNLLLYILIGCSLLAHNNFQWMSHNISY